MSVDKLVFLDESSINTGMTLSSHKVAGVIDLITAAGATLLYLPTYSPDLNPIELLWSNLRKRKAREKDELEHVLSDALLSISQKDILAWFTKCGYGI